MRAGGRVKFGQQLLSKLSQNHERMAPFALSTSTPRTLPLPQFVHASQSIDEYRRCWSKALEISCSWRRGRRTSRRKTAFIDDPFMGVVAAVLIAFPSFSQTSSVLITHLVLSIN